MIITVFNNQQQKPEVYSFVEQEVLIGRNPPSQCSVIVNSHTISRNHMKVRRVGHDIQIMDLNSSNGTFVSEQKVDPQVWKNILKEQKIRLAEFEGFIQIKIREGNVKSNKIVNGTSKQKKQSSSSQSQQQSQKRQRSRENVSQSKKQLPFKISQSTIKMLKDMTINKKSKDQRIKFLKLMGIGKAQEYWNDIEQLIKNKKGLKNTQKTAQQLEKQFNQGRNGLEKKGLGK